MKNYTTTLHAMFLLEKYCIYVQEKQEIQSCNKIIFQKVYNNGWMHS